MRWVITDSLPSHGDSEKCDGSRLSAVDFVMGDTWLLQIMTQRVLRSRRHRADAVFDGAIVFRLSGCLQARSGSIVGRLRVLSARRPCKRNQKVKCGYDFFNSLRCAF